MNFFARLLASQLRDAATSGSNCSFDARGDPQLSAGTYETRGWRVTILESRCGGGPPGSPFDSPGECSRVRARDRYGLCCNIYQNNNMVAHARDHEYPGGPRWKKCVSPQRGTMPAVAQAEIWRFATAVVIFICLGSRSCRCRVICGRPGVEYAE